MLKRWLGSLMVIISAFLFGVHPTHAAPLDLPYLPMKSHSGMQITYEWATLPAVTNTQVEAKLADSYVAGMDTARIHLGWNELEPSQGVYDLSSIVNWLSTAPASVPLYVLIETIDSEGYSLPAYLKGVGQYDVVAGHTFGDAYFNERFAALIDAIYPAFSGRIVYLISVGNEPDNYYDNVAWSSQQGLNYGQSMIDFLNAAKAKIQSKVNWAQTAVAMTVTEGSIQKGRTAAIQPLINASDTAVYNYYCWNVNTWTVPGTVSTTTAINNMLATALGSKKLVLQEVGCPAGYPSGHNPPPSLGATVAKQKAFINSLASNLRKTSNSSKFRAAYWFQLVDWSPELSHTLYTALANEGYPALGLKVEEAFSTIGFIQFPDGVVRSSWANWINLITTVKNCQTTNCTN